VLNTTESRQAISDSRDIRAVALYDKIPYFTTAAASIAAVEAMKARDDGDRGENPPRLTCCPIRAEKGEALPRPARARPFSQSRRQHETE